MHRSKQGEAWPYALFVLSGAAAPILEAVFLRRPALIFGNTSTATALVPAAFTGGLAVRLLRDSPELDPARADLHARRCAALGVFR